MSHSEIELKTSWGETIYGNAWTTEKEPVANIVIAHGMAEYSYRYNEFALKMNEFGYNVYAVDQPGHGLNVTKPTNPKYGLGVWPANGFKLAINYLHELITNVRLNMLPTILLGHSMGSFVSQRYYQRFSSTLDGLILSGSSSRALSFTTGRIVANLLVKFRKKKVLQPSQFFKNIQVNSFNRGIKAFPDGYKSKSRWISANEANVQAFDTDPLCGFTCSLSFYQNLFGGLKPTFQAKRLKEIDNIIPILLVSGKDDPVGGKGKRVLKLKKFYEKGGQRVTAKLYDGMRHEILNEVERETVYNDIASHVAFCVNDHFNKLKAEKHTLKASVLE